MVLPSVNLVPTLFTRGNFSLSVSKRAEGTGAVYAIDSSPTDCLDTAAEKKLCPSQVVQPTRRPPRYPGEELLRKLIFANVTATDSHIKGGVCQAKKIQVYLWGKGNVAQRLSEKSFCFPPSLFARTHAKGNFQIKGGRKHSSSLSPLRWGRREHFPPNVDSSKGEF